MLFVISEQAYILNGTTTWQGFEHEAEVGSVVRSRILKDGGWRQMANQQYLEVVALILLEDDRVLMAQRPEGDPWSGLWEFPGGKVEAGESREAALAREIREELGLEIIVGDCFLAVKRATPVSLQLYAYFGRRGEGEPQSNAHAALAWVKLSELHKLPMPMPDIAVALALQERYCMPSPDSQ